MNRENFKSRIGFLLVSAGCAIGIGNVWKFPFITGINGGGIFVLFYILFLIILGLPILIMELAIGRASKKSIVLAYKALEPKGTKWHIHGYFCIFGCALLMMYYTTVSAWMLIYFKKFLSSEFLIFNNENIATIFTNTLSDPVKMTIYMAFIVIVGFLVCSIGVQKGVEGVTKIMMVLLLLMIIVLVVNSLSLDKAIDGIKFYLLPDINRAKEQGILNVATAAMNQAFFTLSLGVAAMEIFGSYMSSKNTLFNEAGIICILDTFVAILSGLIIFPACFSYSIDPAAGPSLIFITLPNIFINMPYGQIWGTLFFLFMFFASFSTIIAVFENLIANIIDNFNITRKKAAIICCIIILVGSMPCLLGYNILSNVHPMPGKDILDTEDFIVSNLLLPIGSLIFLLFTTSKLGWGFDNYIEECNVGVGIKMKKVFKTYFKYILPILIIIIILSGLFNA